MRPGGLAAEPLRFQKEIDDSSREVMTGGSYIQDDTMDSRDDADGITVRDGQTGTASNGRT
jgi:hypothetical protein